MKAVKSKMKDLVRVSGNIFSDERVSMASRWGSGVGSGERLYSDDDAVQRIKEGVKKTDVLKGRKDDM